MKKFFRNFIKTIVNEEEFSPTTKKALGLFFTIIAIVLGCFWFTTSSLDSFIRFMIFPISYDAPFSGLSFRFPGLINSLWGLFICVPIYLRNFIPFKRLSIYSWLSFSLNWLLFSVMAQLIIGESGSFTSNAGNLFLMITLIISWVGLRSLAGFGWLIVFIVALFSLISTDHHLGVFGFFFLLFSFSSLLFQTKFSPKNLLKNIVIEFKGLNESEGATFMKESVAEATVKTGEALKQGVKGAAKFV